jgi:hypothetical protein
MKFSNHYCTLIATLVCFTLNLISVDIAYAASEAACREYATRASNYQKSNLAQGCGYTGPRWQDNFNNHMRWCLGALPIALDNENSIRTALMRLCQKDPVALRCDAYARQAVAQTQEAAGCGMDSGPRWTASYEGHLTWCINNPPNAAESETREREGLLNRCKANNSLPGRPGNTSSGNKHCASDCGICTREGLRCTTSLDCSGQYPTTAPWLCY